VIVLQTLGAPQRRLLRGRRPKPLGEATEAEPVPVSRATIIHANPFAGESEASAWLERLRGDDTEREAQLGAALAELNSFLRAHRAASADPLVREVSADQALAVRLGHGDGDRVAEGRFQAAFELPRGAASKRRTRRREALAPQERLAAILAGRDEVLVSEELVLRARLDVDARRPREAALQARVALEALLAEVPAESLGETRGPLAADREVVAEASRQALKGDVPEALAARVAEAVEHMEAALRRVRLEGFQAGGRSA
jgi:hypothetical protein